MTKRQTKPERAQYLHSEIIRLHTIYLNKENEAKQLKKEASAIYNEIDKLQDELNQMFKPRKSPTKKD